MTRIYSWIFLVLIFAASAPSGYSGQTPGDDNSSIVITKFHGDIYWRRPFASRWSKIKKNRALPLGALVKVGEKSSLTLQVPPGDGPTTGDPRKWTMIINDPSIFIARPDILRKMTVDKIQISQRLSEFKPEAAEAKTLRRGTFKKFMDAWRLLIPDFPPSAGRIGGDEDEMPEFLEGNLGVSPRPLDLIYPRDRALIYDPARTVSLKSIWKPEAATGQRYYIRIWRKGDTVAPVVGVTDKGEMDLTIEQSGLYYMRVETSDGLWISRIHRFEVYVGKDASQVLTASSNQRQDTLTPINIASDTMVCLPRESHSYVQSFIFPADVPAHGRTRIIVEPLTKDDPRAAPEQLTADPAKGKDLLFQRGEAWIRFKPGRYLWQLIEDHGHGWDQGAARSGVFRLEVSSNCPDVNILLTGQANRRVVFGAKS